MQQLPFLASFPDKAVWCTQPTQSIMSSKAKTLSSISYSSTWPQCLVSAHESVRGLWDAPHASMIRNAYVNDDSAVKGKRAGHQVTLQGRMFDWLLWLLSMRYALASICVICDLLHVQLAVPQQQLSNN